MDLKRLLLSRICCVLLTVGSIGPSVAASAHNLDCTNDFVDLMSCHFEAQNCAEHNVTVWSNSTHKMVHCIAEECGGQCCCSVQMVLVIGESHTVTVWKGGERMESKVIDITNSIKPKTPTIVSVTQTYGKVKIKWKTNMDGTFSNSSNANMTYSKKGGTEKVTKTVQPTIVGGLNYYEMSGQHLEPSTTYLVSVKSYSGWSDRFSDSSEEKEFTTPMSPNALLGPVIIGLSFAAVIISIAIYGCYVKFKTMWWDTVAKCPNPKLFTMHPSEQEILRPVPPILSSICVEPFVPDDSKLWSKVFLSGSSQESSGISDGSSCLSYAITEPAVFIAVQNALGKDLFIISPTSSVTTNPQRKLSKDNALVCAPYNRFGVRADGMSSGSSDFDNITYFNPSCPQEITTNSSEGQVEMFCDSAYQPSEGGVVISPSQQAPTCPLVNLPPLVSPLMMPTDMSYQQCNPDCGRVSYAEDSSLSSICSGSNTVESSDPVPRVEVGSESCEVVGGATMFYGKTRDATVCDEKPCYGCVPACSVDDDYQPFQNPMEQPEILFSEDLSVMKEEHLNKHPEESFNKLSHNFLSSVVPGFITSVPGRESELPQPFLPVICADQSMPMITDGSYQSV
ncbi:uncharacterized protein [Pempheris klunzingeri]|uniref:uncharacterized protein n=1 Tax=Pempheris klunzingeri TaxID=3127111 RepID=UPI00397FF533